MRLQFRLLLWSAAVLLIAAPPSHAAYTVEHLVIAPAGGQVSGGTMSLDFTIGETAVGSGSAGQTSMDCGFWEGVPISTVAVATTNLPAEFSLRQSQPNPFATTTRITYAIPRGEDVPVFLGIYDVRGALIRTLVRQLQTPGIYSVTWDGQVDGGTMARTGVYFARFQAGTFGKTQRIVMLR